MKKKTLVNSKLKLIVDCIVAPRSVTSIDVGDGAVSLNNSSNKSYTIRVYGEEEVMGKVLMKFPSSSNPAKEYNVILGKDGVTYCDCMGWKMNKRCKHLTEFLALPGRKGVKTAKKDPEPKLSTTIDSIVEEIRSGGS